MSLCFYVSFPISVSLCTCVSIVVHGEPLICAHWCPCLSVCVSVPRFVCVCVCILLWPLEKTGKNYNA